MVQRSPKSKPLANPYPYPPCCRSRLAERQPRLAHQPIGKIGRGRIARRGERAHPVGAEGQRFDHAGHRGERQRERVEGAEHRFLIVLQILRICERRSEAHTSELQSLMRLSYAVFCLKKKKKI